MIDKASCSCDSDRGQSGLMCAAIPRLVSLGAKTEAKAWARAGGYSAEELLRKPPLECLVPHID